MIKIFGIVYGGATTEYIPYINTSQDKRWRFENQCMIELIDNIDTHAPALSDDDYLGIFSWKFTLKTGIQKPVLITMIQKSDQVDVFNCSRHHAPQIHFMDWSDQGHKGIKGFIQRCCAHVGLTYTNDPKHIVFANQFVAKKKIYIAYVNEVIKPCLELLEGPMWEEVNKDAGYTRAMPHAKLKKYTGLDFYNYIPFILERMMCQYIHNKNLSCLDINPR